MKEVIEYLNKQMQVISDLQEGMQKVEKVATLPEIEAAERVLGFQLPEILKTIFIEIGNGGHALGPGYGLLGLQKRSGEPSMIDETIEIRNFPCFQSLQKILVLADHGGQIYSCVDCSDFDLPVYEFDGDCLSYCFDDYFPSEELWSIESDTIEEWFMNTPNTWSK